MRVYRAYIQVMRREERETHETIYIVGGKSPKKITSTSAHIHTI
jgi:hypothetical protein